MLFIMSNWRVKQSAYSESLLPHCWIMTSSV